MLIPRLRTCAAALLVAASVFAPASASAGAREDATAITEQLINQNIIDAMFDSIGPLARQALQNALSQGPGAGLSAAARDVVITEFLHSMKNTFLSKMHDEYIQIYMAELTPDELAGLRGFLQTPAGSAYAQKQSALLRRGTEVGGRVGRVVGAEAGQDIGRRLAADGQSLIANPTDLAILRQLFPNPAGAPVLKK
ncbi:MAG: DUF2059 domain-containing protein [Proteobacteria bacterium]|nr:DUF2059 domain-containing protein [Pseudomonadota bacterium]